MLDIDQDSVSAPTGYPADPPGGDVSRGDPSAHQSQNQGDIYYEWPACTLEQALAELPTNPAELGRHAALATQAAELCGAARIAYQTAANARRLPGGVDASRLLRIASDLKATAHGIMPVPKLPGQVLGRDELDGENHY